MGCFYSQEFTRDTSITGHTALTAASEFVVINVSVVIYSFNRSKLKIQVSDRNIQHYIPFK